MKKTIPLRFVGTLMIFLLAFIASNSFAGGHGNIVVANRASGTISVIDAGSDQVTDTVTLPPDVNIPEPMYVVHTPAHHRVWVGDRANNRVVALSGNDYSVVGSVPTGAGVFHMWADKAGKQLWVVNDIDKTVTVVDPRILAVITTVPMPADLVDVGAKPHDVIVHPLGTSAYVTFLDTPDLDSDVVVQFDTQTFMEINRQTVGEDPHIAFNKKFGELYLPCQGSDAVFVLDAGTLEVVGVITIPGAHGAITSKNNRRFFTTNLPGGGDNAVISIDTRTITVLDEADTDFQVPRNVALTPNGEKLYVTHSGAVSNIVSVLDVGNDGTLNLRDEIEVGLNPFGLSHVPLSADSVATFQ